MLALTFGCLKYYAGNLVEVNLLPLNPWRDISLARGAKCLGHECGRSVARADPPEVSVILVMSRNARGARQQPEWYSALHR